MKSLLFFMDARVETIEMKLSGVCAAAKELGWLVQEVELGSTPRAVGDFIKFFNPDGCIIDLDTEMHRVDPSNFPDIPFVYLDVDERLTPKTVHTVRNDSATCAINAFNELVRANPASYAFVPWEEGIDWSQKREKVFLDLATATGKPAKAFDGEWSKADLIGAQSKFAEFLADMPKPCAVLAANDEVADIVLKACRVAGLSVPGDIMLVGIDNCERLCEDAMPPLSSVHADFALGGRQCVEILEDACAGRLKSRVAKTYAPKQLVRRQSSRKLLVDDPLVEKAVELIRREAINGLKAEDVLSGISPVRRTAERRFRLATGRSALEEILEKRFERVLELLANPHQDIGPIANFCGWASEAYLKRYFKKRTGMTMREWRRKHLQE